jgi:hypothetical protein
MTMRGSRHQQSSQMGALSMGVLLFWSEWDHSIEIFRGLTFCGLSTHNYLIYIIFSERFSHKCKSLMIQDRGQTE